MNNIQEIETSVGTFMAGRVEFYENGTVKSAEPEQQVFSVMKPDCTLPTIIRR